MIYKPMQFFFQTAINCWICAVIYVITLLISIKCIHHANKKASFTTKRLEDDEFACEPKPIKIPKKILKEMEMMTKKQKPPLPSMEPDAANVKRKFQTRLSENQMARREDMKLPIDV